MKLIGDNISTAAQPFKSITLRWPAHSRMPAVHGKWKRLADGRIQAVYDPDELALCLVVAEIIAEPDLPD
jgi:hypothetical protein